MATLTPSTTEADRGESVSFVGKGFTAGATVLFEIAELGVSSQIKADAGGYFGTTDEPDHATTTLTSSGVQVTAGDTVTIGAVTYTFRAAVTTTANEVLIGGNAADSLLNLKKAIGLEGPAGKYGSLTVVHPTVEVEAISPTTLLLSAKTGGTGGNSTVSTVVAATLSFPGGTFNSGTPGSVSTGVNTINFHSDKPGTYDAVASDGTNVATCAFKVFS